MKKEIIIVVNKMFTDYSQVYTMSGYRDEQHATLELLKQGFSYYPSTGLFKNAKGTYKEIAKIVDLTDI